MSTFIRSKETELSLLGFGEDILDVQQFDTVQDVERGIVRGRGDTVLGFTSPQMGEVTGTVTMLDKDFQNLRDIAIQIEGSLDGMVKIPFELQVTKYDPVTQDLLYKIRVVECYFNTKYNQSVDKTATAGSVVALNIIGKTIL